MYPQNKTRQQKRLASHLSLIALAVMSDVLVLRYGTVMSDCVATGDDAVGPDSVLAIGGDAEHAR